MLHHILTPAPRVAPLTDRQLRAADAATRSQYLRVLLLMNETACSFEQASAAIAAADAEGQRCDHE